VRRWYVTHSKAGGFQAHLTEVRAWGGFVQWLSEWLCHLTGDRLCSWGRLYPVMNWLHTAEWTARRAGWSVQIDPATAEAMYPPGAWGRTGPHRMPNDPSATEDQQ
jgi:hypothetical protein